MLHRDAEDNQRRTGAPPGNFDKLIQEYNQNLNAITQHSPLCI